MCFPAQVFLDIDSMCLTAHTYGTVIRIFIGHEHSIINGVQFYWETFPYPEVGLKSKDPKRALHPEM